MNTPMKRIHYVIRKMQAHLKQTEFCSLWKCLEKLPSINNMNDGSKNNQKEWYERQKNIYIYLFKKAFCRTKNILSTYPIEQDLQQ